MWNEWIIVDNGWYTTSHHLSIFFRLYIIVVHFVSVCLCILFWIFSFLFFFSLERMRVSFLANNRWSLNDFSRKYTIHRLSQQIQMNSRLPLFLPFRLQRVLFGIVVPFDSLFCSFFHLLFKCTNSHLITEWQLVLVWYFFCMNKIESSVKVWNVQLTENMSHVATQSKNPTIFEIKHTQKKILKLINGKRKKRKAKEWKKGPNFINVDKTFSCAINSGHVRKIMEIIWLSGLNAFIM